MQECLLFLRIPRMIEAGEIFCFDERKVREKDAGGNRQMSML